MNNERMTINFSEDSIVMGRKSRNIGKDESLEDLHVQQTIDPIMSSSPRNITIAKNEARTALDHYQKAIF